MNLLITLLILVLVAGLLWYLFTSVVPLPAPFLKIAQVLLVLIVVLYLLGALFGGVSLPMVRL
jgi:hypothetical protein